MNLSRLPIVLFLVATSLATLSVADNAFAAETESYSKLDPCALVARAEAEKLLGELKEAPKPDTGIQQEKECNYSTTAGTWLKVRLYSSERWGMQKGIVSEMNPTTLDALGEEAFSVQQGTSHEIYVRKGKLILEVSSTVGPELTRKFAEAAVKQLP
jgi:hypothetical protein